MDICETIPFSTLLSLYFQGKATGNKGALYSRSFIQKSLNALGNFVQVRKMEEDEEVEFRNLGLVIFCSVVH